MSNRDYILSDKTYDALKYITEIIFPGVGALYFTLAQIWGLPSAEEVVGSIAAVTVFLGLVLGYSRKSYNESDSKFDGSMQIEERDEGTTFALELDRHPEELEQQKEIKFRVNKQ